MAAMFADADDKLKPMSAEELQNYVASHITEENYNRSSLFQEMFDELAQKTLMDATGEFINYSEKAYRADLKNCEDKYSQMLQKLPQDAEKELAQAQPGEIMTLSIYFKNNRKMAYYRHGELVSYDGKYVIFKDSDYKKIYKIDIEDLAPVSRCRFILEERKETIRKHIEHKTAEYNSRREQERKQIEANFAKVNRDNAERGYFMVNGVWKTRKHLLLQLTQLRRAEIRKQIRKKEEARREAERIAAEKRKQEEREKARRAARKAYEGDAPLFDGAFGVYFGDHYSDYEDWQHKEGNKYYVKAPKADGKDIFGAYVWCDEDGRIYQIQCKIYADGDRKKAVEKSLVTAIKNKYAAYIKRPIFEHGAEIRDVGDGTGTTYFTDAVTSIDIGRYKEVEIRNHEECNFTHKDKKEAYEQREEKRRKEKEAKEDAQRREREKREASKVQNFL